MTPQRHHDSRGSPTPRGSSTQWATTGAPEAPCGAVSARSGSGTQRANPGARAVQHPRSPVPRGSGTQWATPLGPLWKGVVGHEREGTSNKPGWAEPRMTARPPCSVNHPGHHAGAHATRVNHNGAHATRNHQGARHAHARPREWWSARDGRPGQCAEEWGTRGSHTRNRGEAHRPRCVGSENRQTTPATTSTTPVRQLLGTANTQMALAATSTALVHQLLGSANAEKTPAGAQAAVCAPAPAPSACPPAQGSRVSARH